jgi:hypothetical protein
MQQAICADRSPEGCWGYVWAGEISLFHVTRAAILPTRPDQNPKPDQYHHGNGNYLCQMSSAEDRQARRSHGTRSRASAPVKILAIAPTHLALEPPPRESSSRRDHLLSLSDEPSPMFLEMSGDLVSGYFPSFLKR